MSKNITVQKDTPKTEVTPSEASQKAAAKAERVIRLSPRTDVLETKESFRLLLDMPGVGPGEVSVNFEEGVVSVKGRAPSPASGGRTPLHRTYDAKEYYRSFQLPDGVNPTKIDANLQDGVLVLTLPKAEEARPRQIQVKVC